MGQRRVRAAAVQRARPFPAQGWVQGSPCHEREGWPRSTADGSGWPPSPGAVSRGGSARTGRWGGRVAREGRGAEKARSVNQAVCPVFCEAARPRQAQTVGSRGLSLALAGKLNFPALLARSLRRGGAVKGRPWRRGKASLPLTALTRRSTSRAACPSPG
jgi:hypothetical protein